jgi:hypothetical protein
MADQLGADVGVMKTSRLFPSLSLSLFLSLSLPLSGAHSLHGCQMAKCKQYGIVLVYSIAFNALEMEVMVVDACYGCYSNS